MSADVQLPILGPDDDSHLVQAARAGDRTALDTLLRRHHPRISAICRRVTGDRADAADAAQEALMAIVRGLPRFDGRSAFTTWSYRIAVNASLDELRRRRRRPDPVYFGEPADDEAARSTRVPHDLLADEALRSAELRLDLDRALREIPAEFRSALVLRDVCGLDYAEIGSILGVPGGTVRSRIARGRVALSEQLARHETAEESDEAVGRPASGHPVRPNHHGNAPSMPEPGRSARTSNQSTAHRPPTNEP